MRNINPLRAIPTFQPAWIVFGPSPMDRLIGDLRVALDCRDGYSPAYAQACAKLAWANGSRAEYRRANQRDAMRAINAARAAIRARAKAVAAARTALLAAGMTLDAINAACPVWEG